MDEKPVALLALDEELLLGSEIGFVEVELIARLILRSTIEIMTAKEASNNRAVNILTATHSDV